MATFTGLHTLEIYNHRNTAPTDCYNYMDDFALTPQNPDLYIETYNLSVGTGGSTNLTIEAGASHAGEDYFLLASFGSSPGFNIDGQHVNLNMDALFNISRRNPNSARFQNSMGTLDAYGRAVVTFDTLGSVTPTYEGTTLSFAYVLLSGPGQRPVTYSSLPVLLNFIP